MVGDEHQATNIPKCRPLPSKPTASEAKFLQLQPLYLPVEPAAEVVDEKGKVTKTRAGRAGVTCPMPPIGVATSSADFRCDLCNAMIHAELLVKQRVHCCVPHFHCITFTTTTTLM